jgi:glutamyl-tRNA synthetase
MATPSARPTRRFGWPYAATKVTNAFLRRGTLTNIGCWFTFIEETHPEIQSEIKVQDDAVKAKKAALSKAGGSYNMALQDVEKGVVTRFPPEPSYAAIRSYFTHTG